jgi:hypothetical protein
LFNVQPATLSVPFFVAPFLAFFGAAKARVLAVTTINFYSWIFFAFILKLVFLL